MVHTNIGTKLVMTYGEDANELQPKRICQQTYASIASYTPRNKQYRTRTPLSRFEAESRIPLQSVGVFTFLVLNIQGLCPYAVSRVSPPQETSQYACSEDGLSLAGEKAKVRIRFAE